MNEIFKPIKNYEGLYEISNLGRVKSLPKLIGRRYKDESFLKQRVGTPGYMMVELCKDSKVFNASVHRLIAEAFIPNVECKPQVNHIDGNKLNNSIENLEWCTQSENVQHAYKTGLNDRTKHGRSGKRKPLTDVQKQLISEKTKEAMKRQSVREKLHKPRNRKKVV